MKFENYEVSNINHAIMGMRNPLASWDRSDSRFALSGDINFFGIDIADKWVEKMHPELERGTVEYVRKEDEYLEWLFKNGTIKADETGHAYKMTWIGPNDMDLAKRLIAGGPEHRKFLRQIFVSVDITAPLYWWKEFDKYQIGVTTNSTSTMHKLASTPITIDCFETDDYEPDLIFEEGIDDHGDTPYNYSIFVRDVVGAEEENFHQFETIIGFLESLRQKYNETKDKRYWKELVRWLPEGWLQTRTVTMNYENLRTICNQRQGHKLTEWAQFINWAHELPYSTPLIFDEEK